MTLPSSVTRGLLLAITAMLGSCLDIREEYWFHGDGGGRADITYRISAVAARMYGGEAGIRRMIDGFLADTPALTSSRYEVVTEGSRMRVTLHFNFASALDLEHVASGPSLSHLPAAATSLLGNIRLETRGTTMDFAREISPEKALPEAVFLPASQFAGHHLVYIMHLPAAVVESNATSVLDGGRTLVWDMPLEQALKAPFVTRFKARIPIPWRLVISIALPLVLVGGLAFRYLRQIRRRRIPCPTAAESHTTGPAGFPPLSE